MCAFFVFCLFCFVLRSICPECFFVVAFFIFFLTVRRGGGGGGGEREKDKRKSTRLAIVRVRPILTEVWLSFGRVFQYWAIFEKVYSIKI